METETEMKIKCSIGTMFLFYLELISERTQVISKDLKSLTNS